MRSRFGLHLCLKCSRFHAERALLGDESLVVVLSDMSQKKTDVKNAASLRAKFRDNGVLIAQP